MGGLRFRVTTRPRRAPDRGAGMVTLRGTILALVAVATLTPSFAGAMEQLHRSGRWVVDAEGRVVLLHGVNAVWKLAPYAPPVEPRGFQTADSAWLRDHGLNAVRLGVLFAGVMPSAGCVDSSYLAQVDRVGAVL